MNDENLTDVEHKSLAISRAIMSSYDYDHDFDAPLWYEKFVLPHFSEAWARIIGSLPPYADQNDLYCEEWLSFVAKSRQRKHYRMWRDYFLHATVNVEDFCDEHDRIGLHSYWMNEELHDDADLDNSVDFEGVDPCNEWCTGAVLEERGDYNSNLPVFISSSDGFAQESDFGVDDDTLEPRICPKCEDAFAFCSHQDHEGLPAPVCGIPGDDDEYMDEISHDFYLLGLIRYQDPSLAFVFARKSRSSLTASMQRFTDYQSRRGRISRIGKVRESRIKPGVYDGLRAPNYCESWFNDQMVHSNFDICSLTDSAFVESFGKAGFVPLSGIKSRIISLPVLHGARKRGQEFSITRGVILGGMEVLYGRHDSDKLDWLPSNWKALTTKGGLRYFPEKNSFHSTTMSGLAKLLDLGEAKVALRSTGAINMFGRHGEVCRIMESDSFVHSTTIADNNVAAWRIAHNVFVSTVSIRRSAKSTTYDGLDSIQLADKETVKHFSGVDYDRIDCICPSCKANAVDLSNGVFKIADRIYQPRVRITPDQVNMIKFALSKKPDKPVWLIMEKAE